MSILASLARAYDRLPEKPAFGYSRVEVAFCFVLSENGQLAFEPIDLRIPGKGKMLRPKKNLPAPLIQRTSGIKPNFLWDKSAYSLGVTNNHTARTAEEWTEFARFHKKVLAYSHDVGLKAFTKFLDWWRPEQFDTQPWFQGIKDENIVFALEASYREKFLHEIDEAKELWEKILFGEPAIEAQCLVTGKKRRVALSHSPIKNVRGAQSSGAFIVSFNDDAYRSYGHMSGDNAPTSEEAAFKYTTALNLFLERGSRNRIQISDASTVFWADTSNMEVVEQAESIFAYMYGDANPAADDRVEAKKIGILLERLHKGELLDDLDPQLSEGVQFHVLGLAPNAARISIRFYYADNFGVLAKNYQAYVEDFRFEPRSPERRITIKGLVLRTAPARRDRNNKIKFDTEQISPLLSGELFRAVLTGDRFPGALFAQILMRVRSDHLLDSLRVSIMKAVIVRAMRLENRLPLNKFGKPQEDYLVRSDPNDPNPARRLGKLFALIERAQLAALGDQISTTVKDKYLGTCTATPAQIFSKLLQNAEQHHLKRLRNGHSDADWIKDAEHARRVGASINRDIGRLAASFGGSFPAQHSDEEQGLFMIGYYQERFGSRKATDDGAPPADDEGVVEEEGQD